MSNNFPIIVYGANGYTGKLISEYLAKQKLPYIAAGRSQEKLEAAVAELPAGTQVQVKAVEHNEAALTELFQGASIVVNVVGPFGQLGEPVVKAALAAGCHYIDTTGEGDYAINMRDRYSDAYKAKDLVFISACSYMWTAGMIAAELALEDPEIHTLDILYAPRSQPTVASTLSFLRMGCLPQYFKEDGALQVWPANTTLDVAVPGRHAIHVGLPWGGGFEPLWLENDPQVLTCKVMVAFPKGPLTDFVVNKIAQYHEIADKHTSEELEQITNEWGMLVAQTPPKEIPHVNHNIISCWARGTTSGKHIMLYTSSAYLQTGAMVAEACRTILTGGLLATGFQSATKAIGLRQLVGALVKEGLHCEIDGSVVKSKTAQIA